MAHAEVYAEQFGWNTDFEAFVARIVADYANAHHPTRETGWIAEVDGRRVGCVFLVGTDDPEVARLRMLLVTPQGRGRGLGQRLVRTCLDFAVEAGYRQVTLWTNDVLVAARRIYQANGFALVDAEPHTSFGQRLVGETWELDLAGTRQSS